MRRKAKQRWNRWRRYETEKKPLTVRGFTPEAYEKALQKLTKKLKL